MLVQINSKKRRKTLGNNSNTDSALPLRTSTPIDEKSPNPVLFLSVCRGQRKWQTHNEGSVPVSLFSLHESHNHRNGVLFNHCDILPPPTLRLGVGASRVIPSHDGITRAIPVCPMVRGQIRRSPIVSCPHV